jgi:hypothetical protein
LVTFTFSLVSVDASRRGIFDHKCRVCKKILASEKNLKKHVEKVHGEAVTILTQVLNSLAHLPDLSCLFVL